MAGPLPSYPAGDEIFLKAPQWHFLHGGKVTMPVTFLGAVGAGIDLATVAGHAVAIEVVRATQIPARPAAARCIGIGNPGARCGARAAM